MNRTASCTRTTKETDIDLTLNLDGTGKTQIDTGVGFFDHMLDGFARHGLFDLTVKVIGDLDVDCHHTIEDTGIVLGQAILEAIGDKAESGAMGISCCRWMRRLPYAPWISQEGPISDSNLSLQQSVSAIWIRR